jgi:hypothetical protein
VKALAVALTAVATMALAPVTAEARPAPEVVALVPGRLVSSTPLPAEHSLPGAAKAFRISYTSTGFDWRPVTVTGAVFVPAGKAPKGGWPVVAWEHGTVGVADVCAPSANPRSARDTAYLSAWLQAGYAIVATDYEGLGTPGPHQYLHGRSEAFGAIDSVRAARRMGLGLGRKWLAVGQSQGAQGVLFTGPIAPWYAPELDLRGVVATAPFTQVRMTLDAVQPFVPDRPANPFVIPILAGVEAAHPKMFEPADYVTPFGASLLADLMTTDCFTQLAAKSAGHLSQDLYDTDPAEADRVVRLLAQDAEPPIVRHRQPIFIAQGLADTVVSAPSTAVTVDMLRAKGNNLTFRTYPGTDHSGVMAAALPEILTWARTRFTH